jgi:ribose transport system substrate-binding protein
MHCFQLAAREGAVHIKKLNTNRLYFMAILAIILTTLLALLVMTVMRQNLMVDLPDLASQQAFRYHFVMIAEQVDSPFWQDAYAGARQAASEVNAVVELAGSEHFSADQSLQYLDIAVAAKIDGVATCVVDTVKATNAINQAVAANIPVVTVEYDAANSNRLSFIGVNSYDLGQSLGQQLTSQVTSGEVVILVSDDPSSTNISENIILTGLRDYLKLWPAINLTPVKVSRDSAFSAENAIRSLLFEQPLSINCLISLNVEDTLRCVEALVDFGKTNKIGIISYQENSDVLEYVKSGVVQAVLASDPWQIGYDSIQALAEFKRNNRVNEYVPSKLVTITRQNVDQYLTTATTAETKP